MGAVSGLAGGTAAGSAPPICSLPTPSRCRAPAGASAAASASSSWAKGSSSSAAACSSPAAGASTSRPSAGGQGRGAGAAGQGGDQQQGSWGPVGVAVGEGKARGSTGARRATQPALLQSQQPSRAHPPPPAPPPPQPPPAAPARRRAPPAPAPAQQAPAVQVGEGTRGLFGSTATHTAPHNMHAGGGASSHLLLRRGLGHLLLLNLLARQALHLLLGCGSRGQRPRARQGGVSTDTQLQRASAARRWHTSCAAPSAQRRLQRLPLRWQPTTAPPPPGMPAMPGCSSGSSSSANASSANASASAAAGASSAAAGACSCASSSSTRPAKMSSAFSSSSGAGGASSAAGGSSTCMAAGSCTSTCRQAAAGWRG